MPDMRESVLMIDLIWFFIKCIIAFYIAVNLIWLIWFVFYMCLLMMMELVDSIGGLFKEN